MICVRCTSENAVSFRFCRNCGSPLGQPCLKCGFENPSESTFCGGCGARLEEVRAEDARGERRQLTVLFCDIVGSTELSHVLDPEDLAGLIGVYQQMCGDAVAVHQGHIAQYLGDGVVVYFGYPRAHEDDAHRAVRCGLDILRGVRSLRETGKVAPTTALDVRLGADTGRVVVGPVGAGDRKDRIALGDTPNIAARIQSEAEPGTLTVSGATWKIVEGYFKGKDLGDRQFKGLSEPTRLWLITGEAESRERVEVAGALTPFVGRKQEHALLHGVWKEAQEGCSRFVVVWGEPGIGKSRLVQLFRDEVQFQATDLVGLRATPYDTNSPFHPLIELIESRFRLNSGMDPVARLDELELGLQSLGLTAPEAVTLFATLLSLSADDRYPLDDLSPARRRLRTLEFLVNFLEAIAQPGPTLLVAEDVHWMDSSTLDVLELLVKSAPAVPLLGVLTARSEVGRDWVGAPTLSSIELRPFDRTEVETLVQGVTFGKALPGDVLRQIIVRSDGVPLFVEELTRMILDSGVLSEQTASWEAVGPVPTEVVPATMDASLTARIDGLGASRATAQLAATIGREFDVGLLREVSERDEATLGQDLERLVQAGLAWSAGDGAESFVFKHALICDAAYNSLLRSTRQLYHSRIAAALRERFLDVSTSRPDVIAHHLTNAGEDEEAVALWETAGQQALTRIAYHKAAEHFERAIHCLERLPVTQERLERELELQIVLAPLLMATYGWGSTQVERTCERALELAQQLHRYDRSYPALWGLWTVRFLRGELTPALEAANAVLERARASGMAMIQLTGHHAASYTLVYRGEFEKALEEADAGLALYDFEQERKLANEFGLSSSVALHASRGYALWMLGRVVEAERQWDRMLELGRNLGHPPSLAAALVFALHGGGLRYSYAGQLQGLAGLADELMVLSREEDFFLWSTVASTYRGLIAASLGDAAGARTQMHESLERRTQTGSRLTLVTVNILWAEAFCRLGDDDEAFHRLDVAEEEMNTRQEGLLAPDIWRIRGRLLQRQGRRAAAEAAYKLAVERAGAQHALSLELRGALDLYELQAEDGRADEGRARIAHLLGRFTEGWNRPELARARAIVGGAT